MKNNHLNQDEKDTSMMMYQFYKIRMGVVRHLQLWITYRENSLEKSYFTGHEHNIKKNIKLRHSNNVINWTNIWSNIVPQCHQLCSSTVISDQRL